MAKKKEEIKDLEPADIAEEVKPADEAVPAEEIKPAEDVKPAEEIPTAEAEGESAENSKPSFWQKTKCGLAKAGKKTANACVFVGTKTKNGCVKAGRTVKGWLVRKKGTPEAVAAEVEAAETGNGADAAVTSEVKTILSGSNLSKKEKFVRFMRSQSGWLFVLPAVILMCIFTLYPIFSAFINAFKQNYNPTNLRNPYDGWGFENFVRVLKGDTGMGGANFWQCLVNTFIITIISVPLSILIALLISVALNSIKAVQKAYQTILFLPYLTNALAMGAVFATFFKIIGTVRDPGTQGLLNDFLGLFGISPIDWLNPNKHAWGSGTVKIYWASYIAMIIYDVWAGLPFKILILFSSLQSVNKQYYDAAKIDGASKSKILWKITAPMISPMLSYLFITGIMGGMKAYSSVVGLFGENMGKEYKMGTMVGYIYQYIDKKQMGFAFAGSLLLFVIIMIITGISNYMTKKRVTYT